MKKIILIMFMLFGAIIMAAEKITLQDYVFSPYMNKGSGILDKIVIEVFKGSEYDLSIESYPLARAKFYFKDDMNSLVPLAEAGFKQYDPTEFVYIPLMNIKYTFLLKNNGKDITRLDDVKDYTVGTLIGSSLIKKLEPISKKITQVNSLDIAIKMLDLERIDTIYQEYFTLAVSLDKSFPGKKAGFKYSKYYEVMRGGVVLHSDNKKLVNFFKTKLKEMIKSGKYEEVIRKSYTGDIPDELFLSAGDL